MNDWLDSVPMIGMVVVFLAFAISIPFGIANKEQTKQEAIKAGLVQNDKGHWVKPELESTSNLGEANE